MTPAERVHELIQATGRPYAVSVRAGEIDLTPADGKRYKAIQSDPWRAALVVGVYDRAVPLERIAADLAAAGVVTCSETINA